MYKFEKEYIQVNLEIDNNNNNNKMMMKIIIIIIIIIKGGQVLHSPDYVRSLWPHDGLYTWIHELKLLFYTDIYFWCEINFK